MDTEKKREVVIYGILWAVVFALIPLIMTFFGTFSVREMLMSWLEVLPFLVLFLVHDLLVAPVWVDKGKPGLYAVFLIILVALFCTFVWATRKGPDRMPGDRPPMEQVAPPEMGPEGFPPPPFGDGARPAPPDDPGMPMAPEVMKVILGLLVLGVNLGVKFYLRSARNERRMQELMAENLKRQLEGLRYQINPHFFMNTLNNIHALVDIDPDKAKGSIEEFSKLMRYVLYEGDRPTIPLSRELDYLRHYVSLMRMRYADTVRIDMSLPDSDAGAEVPPLVLASFVENAFKHGISYASPSFVRTEVTVEDGKISFQCVNSRQETDAGSDHGVGLVNVRRRLDLLYGGRYTLQIDEGADTYDVRLQLPASAGLSKEEA